MKETEGGPIVVTRNGKPVAVLLAVHDDEKLDDLILAHSPRFQAILENSRRQIREGQTLSHDDFWAGLSESKEEPLTARPAERSVESPACEESDRTPNELGQRLAPELVTGPKRRRFRCLASKSFGKNMTSGQ